MYPFILSIFIWLISICVCCFGIWIGFVE